MDKLDPFIFGTIIFGGGAAMMALHWDKAFRLKQKQQTPDEFRFYRRQTIRRMITSGLIALVGILFMVYRFLPEKSIVRVWLIALVLLLVGIILVFAMIDFSSLRKLYAIQNQCAANATRDLAQELQRLREAADLKKKENPSAEAEKDHGNE